MQLQELSGTISAAAQSVDADPARLQWLDDRMGLIQGLKRKYGATLPEILQFLERASERLHALETRGEKLTELDTRIAARKKALTAAGAALSRARRAAAESLAESVTTELHDLGFPHGAFEVALRAAEPRPSGLDDVEFGFAPNVGEAMRPLRTIASSGEISRVMLATKAVLAAHDRIPVMMFDEIDANVGGEMGHAIGDKLSTVSKNHQVLCITHLPQVAVHGTTHLVVSKQVHDGRTRTEVHAIADEVRVDEVARMLGGRGESDTPRALAREMLAAPER